MCAKSHSNVRIRYQKHAFFPILQRKQAIFLSARCLLFTACPFVMNQDHSTHERTMRSITWQRILAATDFSPLGNQAVDYAHELAEMFGAELHVVHVARNADEAGRQSGTSGLIDPTDVPDVELEWLARLYGETG